MLAFGAAFGVREATATHAGHAVASRSAQSVVEAPRQRGADQSAAGARAAQGSTGASRSPGTTTGPAPRVGTGGLVPCGDQHAGHPDRCLYAVGFVVGRLAVDQGGIRDEHRRPWRQRAQLASAQHALWEQRLRQRHKLGQRHPFSPATEQWLVGQQLRVKQLGLRLKQLGLGLKQLGLGLKQLGLGLKQLGLGLKQLGLGLKQLRVGVRLRRLGHGQRRG